MYFFKQKLSYENILFLLFSTLLVKIKHSLSLQKLYYHTASIIFTTFYRRWATTASLILVFILKIYTPHSHGTSPKYMWVHLFIFPSFLILTPTYVVYQNYTLQ